MTAYYNEIDEKAAAWLRELIRNGYIADGVVDTRSIEDVTPADLAGFTQCHFFAGIGVWNYALRRAGWPDDRPVWTGSCPCQPFSAAGKGGGFDDERHLWPSWFWLIEQCRPDTIFGEQVSSKDGLNWFDLVSADLEGAGYAAGALDTCAAGVGAPHIRQRLYWVADSGGARTGWNARTALGEKASGGSAGYTNGVVIGDTLVIGSGVERLAHHHQRLEGRGQPKRECAAERAARESGVAGGMADADGGERSGFAEFRGAERDGQNTRRSQSRGELEPRGDDAGVRERRRDVSNGAGAQGEHGLREVALRPGPTNGEWGATDWLYSRDGFWRPVEPESQPLAHGIASRVGRLRGYGNGLVAAQAQAFIESWLEATEGAL